MKKIEKLTAEQEALLPVVRKRWTDRYFSAAPIDKSAFKKGADFVYSLCGYEPPRIHYVESPYAMQIKANELLGNTKEENSLIQCQPSTYGNYSDYAWVAFYDFFSTCVTIEPDLLSKFIKYKEWLESNFFDTIQYDTDIIVCPLPKMKVVNNRLHSITGPAVEFPDGFKQCYINNRFVPFELFEKFRKGNITKKEFIELDNADYKGAAYEIMGHAKILELHDAIEINNTMITHKNGEVEEVRLYETKTIDKEIGEKIKFVKFICPSTGTTYIECCNPGVKTALDAMVSRSVFSEITPGNYGMSFRN